MFASSSSTSTTSTSAFTDDNCFVYCACAEELQNMDELIGRLTIENKLAEHYALFKIKTPRGWINANSTQKKQLPQKN